MHPIDKLIAAFREECDIVNEELPRSFSPTWRCEYPESLGQLIHADRNHVMGYFRGLRALRSVKTRISCYLHGEVVIVVVHGTGEAPPADIKTFSEFRQWWTATVPADPGKFSVRDFNLTFTPPC